MTYTLHHGDCLDILPTLPDCSVDSIVTDPPAGIAFMGKEWDKDKGGRVEWIDWMFEVACQCRRVIKPGGHALVWAIPRTSHWTGTAWEAANWQPRDKIYHVFGSGFPKSMDVSKQLDRMAGAEREVVGTGKRSNAPGTVTNKVEWVRDVEYPLTAPATHEAKQWAGWGTALKPAAEEWWLFRKPLEGTVAANVLKHGTGAINVDGCRVGHNDQIQRVTGKAILGGSSDGWDRPWKNSEEGIAKRQAAADISIEKANTLGRWPANFTHDGSDEVERLLGDAARFFYTAKASKADRDEGCEGMEPKVAGIKNDSGRGFSESDPMAKIMRSNHHPTVKPTDLMRYLCRLITPPGGIVLDPFTGSGSTGKAAMLEGFEFIGIEREAEYIEIAKARIERAKRKINDGGRQLVFQFPQE